MEESKPNSKHEWRFPSRKKMGSPDSSEDYELPQNVKDFLSASPQSPELRRTPSPAGSNVSISRKPVGKSSPLPSPRPQSQSSEQNPFDDPRPTSSGSITETFGETTENGSNPARRRDVWKEKLKSRLRKASETSIHSADSTSPPPSARLSSPEKPTIQPPSSAPLPILNTANVPRKPLAPHHNVMSPSRTLPLAALGRLDISNAKRWPGSTPISAATPHPFSQQEDTPPLPTGGSSEGDEPMAAKRSRNTERPAVKKTKGLRVSFSENRPEVIGEGGDEAEMPPIEVKRIKYDHKGEGGFLGVPAVEGDVDTDDGMRGEQTGGRRKSSERVPSPMVGKRKPITPGRGGDEAGKDPFDG